jgi:hypothetical protein
MNPADRPRFHADFSRALAFATALHATQIRKRTVAAMQQLAQQG